MQKIPKSFFQQENREKIHVKSLILYESVRRVARLRLKPIFETIHIGE